MRLIDADRLKEAIHTDFSEHFTLYHDTDQTALFDMVMDDIDEIPTAFDKEKVIDDLNDRVRDAENCAAKYDEIGDIDNMDLQNMAVICYEISIKIVEKGGIE